MPEKERPLRADARRNIEALLEAAKDAFAASGVDAPVRDIAERAGVGLGTLYRHFPQRSDLIVAVFQRELDACAATAPLLAAEYGPGEALAKWIDRYQELIATKRGLATALHSGDPAYDSLPNCFKASLVPALQPLLDAAVVSGEFRAGASAEEILFAIASLSSGDYGQSPESGRRLVALFVDGLRYYAKAST